MYLNNNNKNAFINNNQFYNNNATRNTPIPITKATKPRNGNHSNQNVNIPMSMEKAANLEALVKARYFAFDQKRTLPPRINPIGLLCLILSAGLMFIGLTITIVSHWPGLATLGENRFKIAGPVLLVIGFIGLIASIISMIYWTKISNRKWEKRMTEKAHHYISSAQSQSESNTSISFNAFNNNNNNNNKQKRLPGQHRMILNEEEVGQDNKNFSNDGEGDESSIPDPFRKQKYTHQFVPKTPNLNSSVSTNQSFSAGEGDMSIPGYKNNNNNFYNEQYNNQKIKKITTTTTTTVTKKRKQTKNDIDDQPIRNPIENQRLKIKIKASPKTKIQITPTHTPRTGGQMGTEI